MLKYTTEALASNKVGCEYILGYRKFLRSHDDGFDLFGSYQRLGKTSTKQDAEFIRWTGGRASDRVAINTMLGIFKCVPPEEVKEEIRSRITGSLKNLGNLAGYVEAAKKIKALTSASPKAEVCAAYTVMKKESDKIEPDIEEFAVLYVADGDAKPNARTVEFADARITQRAEKILDLRANLFLPVKAEIKSNWAKYGCK